MITANFGEHKGKMKINKNSRYSSGVANKIHKLNNK